MAATGNGRLTVARLTVRNVLGVEDHTIDVDKVTLLSGRNASGKSSHLAALRSALGIDRTTLARLARVHEPGASAGEAEDPSVEVLLVGESGDRELLVTRRGDGSPEVRERVGEDWRKVPRPIEYLRQLIDVRAAVPALWLEMDDEQKAQAVLEAMPLSNYSRADALQQAGLEGFRLPPIPAGLHALEDLELVEAAVFSARTEVNRQQRAEHDAAQKLLSGLPAEAPKDASNEVEKLQAQATALSGEVAKAEAIAVGEEKREVEAADAALALVEENVSGTFRTAAAKLRAAAEKRVADFAAQVKAETDAQVEELRSKGEDELEAEQNRAEHRKIVAREKREAARQATAAKQAELGSMSERLATLRAQQEAIATDRHVRATAEVAEEKAREHELRADALTKSLAALTRYKLKLAEQLPIPGLSVRFDDKGRKSLTLDGIPLSTVNSGRLYKLATEVTLVRNDAPDDGSPRVRLVLLDGLEKLDHETRAGLLRECASRGTQVIAAVVSDTTMQTLRGEDALAATA